MEYAMDYDAAMQLCKRQRGQGGARRRRVPRAEQNDCGVPPI